MSMVKVCPLLKSSARHWPAIDLFTCPFHSIHSEQFSTFSKRQNESKVEKIPYDWALNQWNGQKFKNQDSTSGFSKNSHKVRTDNVPRNPQTSCHPFPARLLPVSVHPPRVCVIHKLTARHRMSLFRCQPRIKQTHTHTRRTKFISTLESLESAGGQNKNNKKMGLLMPRKENRRLGRQSGKRKISKPKWRKGQKL